MNENAFKHVNLSEVSALMPVAIGRGRLISSRLYSIALWRMNKEIA
jgi:hypothetical protein